MSGLRDGRLREIVIILAVTAFALAGGEAVGDYWLYVLAIGIAQSVFGLSIGVVYGQAGMLSVAQVSIGAVGAWSVAALSGGAAGGLPLFVSFPIGALLSVLLGLACALPALRLRHINLAVVTLGIVLAVYTVAKAGQIPGSQITLYVPPPQWGDGYRGLYWFCWLSFAGLAIVTVFIRRTRMGLSWQAIARSERAAAAMGISVLRAKLTAFAVAAALAGWAGGLLVVAFGSADPANFEPVQVITLFVLAVMMGAGLWEGALALGLFNAVSSALLRKWGLSPDIGSFLFAIGAVQILATESGGFSYDLRRLIRWIGRRLRPGAGGVVAAPLRRLEHAPAPRPASSDVALKLEGLTVRYGALTALDGVSFEVNRGAIVGLIGPNGAGKSTLVDAVTGFVGSYAGMVVAGGRNIDGLRAFQRGQFVRRTFQTERTMSELRPRDFLRLAAGRRASDAEIDAILDFVGSPPDAGLIGALDVRSRRLLTIGSCLVGQPIAVLIDEPAAGLTAEESEDLAARIRDIPLRFGCGVLLIEHDMELVRNTCDRLVVLDFGKQIAEGPTAEVLGDSRVMAAYLGVESPDEAIPTPVGEPTFG